MQRTFIGIYALAVCFVAVVAFSITLGVASYDFVELSAPELTLPGYEYERHHSNLAFRQFHRSPRHGSEGGDALAGLSEEEVSAEREQSYRIVLDIERRNALQSLLRAAIVLLINLVLFVLHGQILRREQHIGEGGAGVEKATSG